MLLLARPSMPDSHTWRLTDALIRSGKFSNKINDTEIPVHNGSNIRFMNLPCQVNLFMKKMIYSLNHYPGYMYLSSFFLIFKYVASNACSISYIISSMCSIPTDSLTYDSDTPAFNLSLALS